MKELNDFDKAWDLFEQERIYPIKYLLINHFLMETKEQGIYVCDLKI